MFRLTLLSKVISRAPFATKNIGFRGVSSYQGPQKQDHNNRQKDIKSANDTITDDITLLCVVVPEVRVGASALVKEGVDALGEMLNDEGFFD